jgi:hypothetical protein
LDILKTPFHFVQKPHVEGQKSSNFGCRTSLSTRPTIIWRGIIGDNSFCSRCDTFGFTAESPPHKTICTPRSATMARSAALRANYSAALGACMRTISVGASATLQLKQPSLVTKLDGANIVCDEMATIAFFAIVLRNSTSAAGVQERPRGRPMALIGSWPFPMDILPHTNHRRNDTKLIKLQGHLIFPWAQKADAPGHDRLWRSYILLLSEPSTSSSSSILLLHEPDNPFARNGQHNQR